MGAHQPLAAPRAIAILLLLVWAAFAGAAHPATMASATLKVQPDGAFRLIVRFDVLAFATDELPADADDHLMLALLEGSAESLKEALSRSEKQFRGGLQVLGDGQNSVLDALSFPDASEVQRWRVDSEQRLPVSASVVVTGRLPEGSKTVSVRMPELLGTTVLITEFPYREPVSEPVEAGRSSTMLPIPSSGEVKRAAAEMMPEAKLPMAPKKILPETEPHTASGPKESAAPPVVGAVQGPPEVPAVEKEKQQPLTASEPETPAPIPDEQEVVPAVPVQSMSPAHTVISYGKLGYTHILPGGLDHILFVVGLCLLSRKNKALLAQISLFTVAHSVTLALSLYDVVRLPSSVVEPLIALSILLVAADNLRSRQVHGLRLPLVFAFGLLHGLGFASSLSDVGLPRADLLGALVSFNVGVELGQLTVVGLVLAAIAAVPKEQRHKRVVVPVSCAIALIACFWTVERLI